MRSQTLELFCDLSLKVAKHSTVKTKHDRRIDDLILRVRKIQVDW